MSTKPGHTIGFENAVEQHKLVALKVKGQIPSWLSGSLYRTGPGTFRIPSESAPNSVVNMSHWFDGLGMSHRFLITPDGSVFYRNHSTTDGSKSRIAEVGGVPGITFGVQDPCETLFSKFSTFFKPGSKNDAPDDVNISVTLSPNMPGIAAHHTASATSPNYIVAKSDASILQILDANTLKPLKKTTYAGIDPRLDGHISAAHSCQDPLTGELFNFSLKIGPNPSYKIFRICPAKNTQGYSVDILAKIKDAPAAYVHSFALTQKYIVLCIWQADFKHLGAGVPFHRSILSGLKKEWDSNRFARFYVIDRKQGDVVSQFQSPPFFAFHTINAYDSGADDVVMDIAIYDDHSILDLLYLEKLRNLNEHTRMKGGQARRFILENVRQGQGETREAKVVYTLPESSSIELPTVHPALYHKPYRFAYGINNNDRNNQYTFVDGLIKLDMSDPNSEPKTWGAPGYTPGEPIFIPRPGSSPDAEDDGMVLSVVLDASTQKSMLIVLDAKDMTEVARAEMDRHFPFGFHGAWVPTAPTARL